MKVIMNDSEVAELDRILKSIENPRLQHLTMDEWLALKGKFDQLSQM
jgi:hypothetical protein